MRQPSFYSLGFDRARKQTRRERFLAEMEMVVPWAALSALIEPHYPSGERGRPPIGIERMLRIYFLVSAVVKLTHVPFEICTMQ
ncbi:MAG: hypothetical protein ING96_17515, partial [Roseomonas sp.]|nr:hypothetical protein [Roseomonas sp.]